VHLVGFIIRIYHNARSPERQTPKMTKVMKLIPLVDLPGTAGSSRWVGLWRISPTVT
jgi:hypothetical protein